MSPTPYYPGGEIPMGELHPDIRQDAFNVFGMMAQEVEMLNRSKGWYDEERSVGDMIALLHSEVSEILDAYRQWKFADPTPTWTNSPEINKKLDEKGHKPAKPEGVAAEMADTLIRLLDMAKRWDIDLVAEYERKMKYNWTRPYRHGGRTL